MPQDENGAGLPHAGIMGQLDGTVIMQRQTEMMDDQGAQDEDSTRPASPPSTSGLGKREESGRSPCDPGGVGGAGETRAEVEIWVGRTHWKHYAGRLGVWGVCNLVFAVIAGWIAAHYEQVSAGVACSLIAAVFVVSGLIVVGRVMWTVLSHRYRVTSQRLFIETGILSQTVDQTELIRVDDLRLAKSFLDRMLGLGSIEIISTDASNKEVLIEGIPEPEKVAEAIRSNMRTLRQRSLFVENL